MEITPRHNAHDGHQRAHVEDQNAHDDFVHGFRQHLARILRFRHRNAHEFDEQVGEEHHLEAHEEAHPTVWRDLEAVDQIAQTHRRARNSAVNALDVRGRVMEADDEHHHGGGDQAHNQRDLDHGEPEFRFAEHFHGNQVDACERHEEAQFDQPFPCFEIDVEHAEERDEIRADGCDFGHAGQDEHDPVRPAGEFAPSAAEIAGDEVDEGVLAGVAVHHFADGAHQQEHDQTDADVHEDDARTGQCDRLAGTEEQPCADGAADGDELHMAIVEASGHLVAFIERLDGFGGYRRRGLGGSHVGRRGFGLHTALAGGVRILVSHNDFHPTPRIAHPSRN